METNTVSFIKIDAVRLAYLVLYITFIALPVIAGLDAFFNILVSWDRYVAPFFPSIINVTPELFIKGVGILEIIIGLLITFQPRWGGYVLMVWFWLVVVNCIILGNYYDITIDIFALSMAALALAKLGEAFETIQKGN